ncbi:MAG: tetratricopeptide repeat protein [Alphaproteobacteria bacterium]
MTNPNPIFEQAFEKHQAGDIGTAAKLYRTVLEKDPGHSDAMHMLGIIAQQTKKPELALDLMDRALAQNPNMAMAWCNRCIVLRVLGRRDEALQSAKKALAVDPHIADGWDLAGSILREMGQYEESCAHHKRAVELQPGNVRFQSNYTALLLAVGDLHKAYQSARTSEQIDKEFIPLPLGNVLQAAGYPERAIPHFRKSYEILPHFHEARLNEAMALLQIGDFEKGWELWETRPDDKALFQHIPRWQGEKISHLLIHEDQGMGDALQLVRYIPLIRERADKITLQLTGHLHELMASNFPNIDVLTLDDPVPKANARIQLMSLPYLLKTRLETIPASVPYLKADQNLRKIWQEKISKIKSPRIGIVWAGNAHNRNDLNRSIDFLKVRPLLEKYGAHCISLQKGRPEEQKELQALHIFDADPELKNFSDTAALLAELDLVITVDTAAAHLAGAMGVPVWLLLPFEPEWRWMHGRSDSPWYPSMRIFRQTAPRDWPALIARVLAELQKWIDENDDAVLKAEAWPHSPLRQNPHALKLEECDE